MKSAIARLSLLLVLAAILPGGSCFWSFKSGDGNDDDDDFNGGIIVIVEEATFGGWDVGPVLGSRPGVLSVTPGWDGGMLPFLGASLAPWTGQARVSQVRFDPAQVSFAELVGAVRAERLGTWRMSVYAASPEQELEAAALFPAGTLPQLRLRTAGCFTPAD